MTEMPNLITASEPPSAELYAMECTLEVSNGERTCKWSGFASLEVVSAMLEMMREVVGR